MSAQSGPSIEVALEAECSDRVGNFLDFHSRPRIHRIINIDKSVLEMCYSNCISIHADRLPMVISTINASRPISDLADYAV